MSDLFSWAETPRARNTDPDTSHYTAERAGSLAAQHYDAIKRALATGPGTIYQLADITGLSHVQVARRLPELEKFGLAETTGETRSSPSGRPCRVWAGRQQEAVGE